MNRAVMPITDYENACDKIREKTETTDLIKSGELPEKIDEVYEAGQVSGQKTEYDRMWDVIQKKGDSVTTDYTPQSGVFNGRMFTFTNFYPKYDIRPVGSAAFLFYAWEKRENIQGSLTERLKECGVVLDTSKATNLTHIFNYSRFTELPTIDFSSVTEDSIGCFANNWGTLKTIEKIIVHENLKYSKWFNNSQGLESVTFEGIIGQNGLSFSSSPLLTETTLRSIVGCLKAFRETIVEDFAVEDNTQGVPFATHSLVVGQKYICKYHSSFASGVSEVVPETITIPTVGERLCLSFQVTDPIGGAYQVYFYDNDGVLCIYDDTAELLNRTISLTTVTETRSITFHADSVAKLETLTEGGKTLKQIANDKGWTVIEA